VQPDHLGRFKLLCVYDATDQLRELEHAKGGLLVLWPLLVALLGVASYLAVGSSFKPLHKLLSQAGTLSINDRLQTADQAEFGELATSINSYLDRIEKVVKQQEEFAVDAAHELCTPLTALRGQLELALLQKGNATAYADAAKSAIGQVSRLERLVESLLLATRPRDGDVTPCDAQRALEEVQARWVDRYATHKVDLQLSAEAFKAAMPEEEIESVMENLLANALKFSPPGTTVRITLDAQGHLIVQDQGPGIPVDDRERVFERFERGTTKARGFGIGLYLVRRLLEQRGGAIRIGESPVGARVEVALPA
jgi:two-component system OmpR family sensor kinase